MKRVASGALVAVLALGWHGLRAEAPADTLTLTLTDFATMPMTGVVTGTGNDGSLARVNFMREEPGDSGRFFVSDLNGPLYILDKRTKQLTTYLNFNGRDGAPGLFHKFTFATGYANGLVEFQFDPDYRRNGKFYTIHLEDPTVAGSAVPDNSHVPGLNVAGYQTTPAVRTPGPTEREAVLIEWTDTKPSDAVFEGTARELLRVQFNTHIHPMGDLIFNPTAKPGDADWRVMYLADGDGGAGEQRAAIMRMNPQRLDTLVGKILRIVPDLDEHVETSTVSDNGHYRIPNDNPFVGTPGARKEIWALGFRNPHRLTWDVNPTNPRDNHLIANVIGLHTWETVDIIHKGANYGYSLREGNERLKLDNTTEALPDDDTIPVRVNATTTVSTVTPTYPVLEYGHVKDGGDAIAGGFVYRGKALPALRGKYVFGDISTGRLWYADFQEMLRADDGKPGTMAQAHELHLAWKNPADAKAGLETYDSLRPIVLAAYLGRGGKDADLPGTATVSGSGRVNMRLAVNAAGELYLSSKSDGMIRKVVGARP